MREMFLLPPPRHTKGAYDVAKEPLPSFIGPIGTLRQIFPAVPKKLPVTNSATRGFGDVRRFHIFAYE